MKTSIFGSNSKTYFFKTALMMALIVPAVAMSQSFPAPVNLGTAGDFVLLAKTGISTTGTTAITGDLGVSPAAATFITGFGLIADATNTFSTSSLVTGKIYAASYAAPTPTKMTTAIGDMQTAYTNAAGRTLPDHTELGAGNVTGMTLTRGLYKWSSSLLVSAGGVTISGSATDVWIFQIAGDLTLANGAAVTLSGGALASNIFWQVAGQVTLGTTAAMKGNILCQTQIALNTGATLTGSALAQTAITLISNAIITKSAAIAVPGAPTGLTGTTGSGQVSLSWIAPASNGGSLITAYTVKAVQDTSKHCTTTGALTCIVASLTGSTAYTFTVTATNAVGTSTASNPSTAITTTGINNLSDENGFGIQMSGTSVMFHIPSGVSSAQISIMDISGRTIWSQTFAQNVLNMTWNGITTSGHNVGSGIYLVRITMVNANHRVLGEIDRRIAYAP